MCPSEKRWSCCSTVKRKFLLFALCWEHLSYFLFFVCIIKAGLGWPSSNCCSYCSGFTQLEQCLQGLQSRAVLRTGWVGWNRRHRVCSPCTAEPSAQQHQHPARSQLPAKAKPSTSLCQAALDTSYKYLPLPEMAIKLLLQQCRKHYL